MKINKKNYRTIWYDKKEDNVKIIDQTQLPHKLEIVSLKSLEDTLIAIKNMQVRGAPLIGATAAYGIYLAYRELSNKTKIYEASKKIKSTRPTAVNLFWAVDKMMKIIDLNLPFRETEKKLLNEANKLCEEDIQNCKKIGEFGFEIIKKISERKKEINVLTHCNAGWLATIDWGTATAPIYLAKKNNLNIHVWVDETRPRNQGALLTSYELNNENINNTVITDNTAGLLMQRKEIDLCIVGADRVTSNGHVANKIGTFLKALAAKEFNIPFYVAVPYSTIDWNIKNFKDIIIEERDESELKQIKGIDDSNKIRTINVYPSDSKVYNPAFDLTPNKFITNLITNKGVIRPNERDIIKLKNE